MKELMISLPKSSLPKYQILAEGLRNAIRSGQITPGEILPSSRELAHKFRMNRHTIMRSLAELVAEGWLLANEKKHYQVTPTLPTDYLHAKNLKFSNQVFSPKRLRLAREVKKTEYATVDKLKFSFPSGAPDVREFPMGEFKSCLYDALKSHRHLGYGSPFGYEPLQEQIETYLRRVRRVQQREIIITNGSQEALFFIAQLLIKPGDVVAVESLGYPPALEALRFAGAKLLPIPLDREGLRVDVLEQMVRKHQIRMIYTTPLHQYPTTVTLSAQRRLFLYELCYRNDIFILEDDYDHEFHYRSQPIAPLAANDPAGIVLYVSTFSKVLFPSARIGFMAVPTEIANEAAKLKRISSRQNEQLFQVAIAQWMKEGGFEKHLRKMRRLYEGRRDAMIKNLCEHQAEHPQISWNDPDGGMALWLNLNQDTLALARAAREAQIQVNPEANYSLTSAKGTHLRLGFSGQTPHENKVALRALFNFIGTRKTYGITPKTL
jgi:GntR family transcriptional regulator/MocR family aminotransferase